MLFCGLYVKCWGRAKEISNHKESWAVAQLSLWLALNGSAVEYSVAEPRKITNTEAHALKHFGLVIAALCEAVGVGIIKRVEYVFAPIVDRT